MPRFSLWALVFAGAAVVLCFGTAVVENPRPRPPDAELVEVRVVRKDLPIGTLLDESTVRTHLGRTHEWRNRLPADAIGDEARVLGKEISPTLPGNDGHGSGPGFVGTR